MEKPTMTPDPLAPGPSQHTITIDRTKYVVHGDILTGEAVFVLAGKSPATTKIFEVIPGDFDRDLDYDDEMKAQDGLRFFTTPRYINASAPHCPECKAPEGTAHFDTCGESRCTKCGARQRDCVKGSCRRLDDPLAPEGVQAAREAWNDWEAFCCDEQEIPDTTLVKARSYIATLAALSPLVTDETSEGEK
jgi:hypothetical protein